MADATASRTPVLLEETTDCARFHPGYARAGSSPVAPLAGEDGREAVRAIFEKRKPRFTGAGPAGTTVRGPLDRSGTPTRSGSLRRQAGCGSASAAS
jgi:hypothetical protein